MLPTARVVMYVVCRDVVCSTVGECIVNAFACLIAVSRQYLRRHWGRTDPSSVAIVPARWSSDNDRGM